jgi:hypothetical protein
MRIFAREAVQMLVQKLNPWRGDPLDYKHFKGVECRISQNECETLFGVWAQIGKFNWRGARML